MWASSRKQADPFGVSVAARALEHGAAVMNDVRRDVDLRVGPLHQLAVHPDLPGTGKRHRLLLGVRILLRLPAERTPVRAGVQGLVAFPAEAGLRALPRLGPRGLLRLGRFRRRCPGAGRSAVRLGAVRSAPSRSSSTSAARWYRSATSGRHRLQNDVVDALRDAAVPQARRRHQVARASAAPGRPGAGVWYGSVPVIIWYIVTPSE